MKNKRQEALLRLIRENSIGKQEDLTAALLALGFKVTQSTVSRDIKELRITKTLDNNGNYRYISPAESISAGGNFEKYIDIFSNAAISVRYSMNDVVIRCYSGMASSACVAVDHLYKDMIVGSLAGDDTIFIITESQTDAHKLTESLNKLL